MTHDLLLGSTRLWWTNGHGLARHDDVQVALRNRPSVLLREVQHLEEIEYAPAVHMYYVQARGERRRELEPEERREVGEYLRQMAVHVRQWFMSRTSA